MLSACDDNMSLFKLSPCDDNMSPRAGKKVVDLQNQNTLNAKRVQRFSPCNKDNLENVFKHFFM